jgi:hypothetical protein
MIYSSKKKKIQATVHPIFKAIQTAKKTSINLQSASKKPKTAKDSNLQSDSKRLLICNLPAKDSKKRKTATNLQSAKKNSN